MSLLLDPSQRLAITPPRTTSILLTGEAGSGKTTAALHRLAALQSRAERPLSCLVLAPGGGLGAKIGRILRTLRSSAEVGTVDGWLSALARLRFSGLADVDSEDATAGVIRLKRHPAVRVGIAAVAAAGRGDATRDDLFELWGDRALLDAILSAAGGALSAGDARAVLDHALIQFAELDRDTSGALVLGMGGIPIHEGTPLHDALTCDVEDYPVLFELARLRGRARLPCRYDHILIDEAQELAPLELALIGRALKAGGGLTVVGDAGQQVDETAWFAGWTPTLAALGVPDALRIHLQQHHRCPPAVRALAAAVRDDRPLPASTPTAQVGEGSLVDWLRESAAPTLVVAPDAAAARRLHARLPPALGARLALRGLSRLPARLVVTPVSAVRGLEVARVAVPDLSGWPPSARSRRALYVALTRATAGVWLAEPQWLVV